ncbi:MAG TPA: ribonuclease P protein component [Candidatus Paceibacterota bacterium]|nr:ribonuclease P protein component [Candidatus Paceibacterota bacterium]
MLPSRHRLKRTKDFKGLATKRPGVRVSGLLLKTGTSRQEATRFGIVVSKKVAKRAVERNLIRRRLRAAIREELPEVKPGLNVALIVLPGFNLQGAEEMQKSLHKLFEKASLFQ